MKITTVADSATIGTSEYSLPADTSVGVPTSQTDDCILEAMIDFSAMAAGDEYLVKLYETVNGVRGVAWFSYLAGAQSALCAVPRASLGVGWDLTVQKISGTSRAIGWRLNRHVEGETVAPVTVGAAGIADTSFAVSAITAGAIAPSAVLELQLGLATEAQATANTSFLTGQISPAKLAAPTLLAGVADLQARTPAALVGGKMDASVGAVESGALTDIAAAVWAFAHETGRTAKGVLTRIDALITGKATGLLGTVFTLFRADGVTKAVEATQDTVAGTRESASTISGD